jgi:Tol biopolymer transport system component
MILRNILILSLLLIYINLLAQIPRKRLPQNINVPTYSHIFPSLSGDGNQMIYLTNYTNSEGFETKYTIKNGAESWEDPEPISSINRPGQDHIGSFCLSYDGNYVVFSSRRSPSIGNFDIFISERKGNYWSQPQNPGKPLNSPANEGNPSLSPDGKSIYFTRCEKMNNTTKDKCTIYVSHRISSLRWSEPEKLPEHINAGHETTPRIMADNKTLVFASGRPGGKGKLDLYQATLQYGTWSRPVALSYINTVDNDEYVSIPARGDVIYFTGTYRDHFNIYKAIIPQEFRPQKSPDVSW